MMVIQIIMAFSYIQLPYNLAYSEPLLLKSQNVGNEKNLSILETYIKTKIGIFTSIPLFQGRTPGSTIFLAPMKI